MSVRINLQPPATPPLALTPVGAAIPAVPNPAPAVVPAPVAAAPAVVDPSERTKFVGALAMITHVSVAWFYNGMAKWAVQELQNKCNQLIQISANNNVTASLCEVDASCQDLCPMYPVFGTPEPAASVYSVALGCVSIAAGVLPYIAYAGNSSPLRVKVAGGLSLAVGTSTLIQSALAPAVLRPSPLKPMADALGGSALAMGGYLLTQGAGGLRATCSKIGDCCKTIFSCFCRG